MVELIHDTTFSSIEAARSAVENEHPGDYGAAWWGVKDSAHIKNLGLVIGFRDEEKKQRWRIDFDPDKGLHINWSKDLKGDAAEKVCYKISTSRNPQEAMQDYMIGLTKPRYDEVPADVKSKLGDRTFWTGAFWSTT